MFVNISKSAIVVFTITSLSHAIPQSYPNKCGDQVCPADRPKCCEVIVNGVAELGCFSECPPVSSSNNLQRRQSYPNKCGDQVCPPDRAKCCEVIFNGIAELGCFDVCPAVTASAVAPAPTFGPKCGDSFFCPVGKICCPNRLYTCADTADQCPK
ncbi:hypothetical protein E4U55_002142 [Claviceps digitariae]|nr:hypothetical protein E4U55_002142 [Claviceps digitariae]